MVYLFEVRKSPAELQGTNDVAQAISGLITQAADRTFPACWGRMLFQRKGRLWYNAGFRYLRGLVISAGGSLTNAIGTTDNDNDNHDSDELIDKCRHYRACKQRKKKVLSKLQNCPDWQHMR